MLTRDSGRDASFRLGPPIDSDGFLRLFALVFGSSASERDQWPRDLTPGVFLKWATRRSPSMEDLRAGAAAANPPNNWPEQLRLQWRYGSNSLFFSSLRLCLQHAQVLGVRDGAQVCRLLAGVAQTHLTKNEDYRRTNLALVRQYSDFSDDEGLEIPAALDESGGRLEGDGVVLWHASHSGPAYADHTENQDTTYAVEVGGTLAFALSDGVTTSLGSRVAAAWIVQHFCHFVRRELSTGAFRVADGLVDAARATQLWLDIQLEHLLRQPNADLMREIRGKLPTENALAFLRNTEEPKRPYPAALTATLIGGIVRRLDANRHDAHILRIGDGVVEHISRTGEVSSVMAMDSSVSEISNALGPGPVSRAGLEGGFTRKSVELFPGDSLLLSSDGLANGHSDQVASKLSELLRGDLRRRFDTSRTAAYQVLQRVAAIADGLHHRNSAQIFGDNLSLILIKASD